MRRLERSVAVEMSPRHCVGPRDGSPSQERASGGALGLGQLMRIPLYSATDAVIIRQVIVDLRVAGVG